MKTANLIINEAKGTITFINPERTLTQFENKLVSQYSKQGFKIRKKRKKNANANHKLGYYIDKLEQMEDLEYLQIFNEIKKNASFATAVKWYRNKFDIDPYKVGENGVIDAELICFEIEATYCTSLQEKTILDQVAA